MFVNFYLYNEISQMIGVLMRKHLSNYFYSFFTILFSVFCCLFVDCSVYADETTAQFLDAQITISDGSDASVLKDQYHSSKIALPADTAIQIQTSDKIGAIYIIWDHPVSGWTLLEGNRTSSHGEYGFLHEYVPLKRNSDHITIQIPESGATICDIIVLSPGTPPSSIQIWEPPCKQADLLLLSTHADDEHLFFGGTMPYYAGEKGLHVQVVYFCSHAANEPYREHEKLNGMWLEGVHNYPVMGHFPDEYSTSLETALTQYNYDEAVSFIVTQLRRFQPLVALGQDLNGEYGHGSHCLTAKALTDAVQLSNQPDYDIPSAEQYGVWNVPKTYLHLYPENRIHMNWNIPLEHFGGQTALQMADAGYKTHQSQQWCWFYVSDLYEYSCAEFGLFRSLVGPDVIGGDFMENVTPYPEQPEPTPEETTSIHTSSAQTEKSTVSKKEFTSSAKTTQTTSDEQSSEINSSSSEITEQSLSQSFTSFLSGIPISSGIFILLVIIIIIIIFIIILILR